MEPEAAIGLSLPACDGGGAIAQKGVRLAGGTSREVQGAVRRAPPNIAELGPSDDFG